MGDSQQLGWLGEEYTDLKELRSLAQLVGPYGVKFMTERLIWSVACQVTEMYVSLLC